MRYWYLFILKDLFKLKTFLSIFASIKDGIECFNSKKIYKHYLLFCVSAKSILLDSFNHNLGF